jgi:tRNA (guanine-N7-)-methyltransferase
MNGLAIDSTSDHQAPAEESGHQPLIYRPKSITDRLNLAALFARGQPLEVELGSGDGSFLLEYASRFPERNFLGVERLLGRLRKIDRKGLRAGLRNLRLLRVEASYLVDYLLPHGSIRTFHIYFPDPWPKRRHRKNRLVNELFAEKAYQALEPGGFIFLRTDDANYFEQMRGVFDANLNFRPYDIPQELAEITTDFEREFVRQGIPALKTAYQSLPRTGA